MYVCMYAYTGRPATTTAPRSVGKLIVSCRLPGRGRQGGGGGPSLKRLWEEHYWRNRGRQFLRGSNAPQEVGADHHLLNTSHAPRVGMRSVQGQ